MLNNLGPFFDKFKKIENQNLLVCILTKKILEKNFSISLKKNEIKFKKGTIYFLVSGPAKLEIMTQKNDLIKEINTSFGKEVVFKVT